MGKFTQGEENKVDGCEGSRSCIGNVLSGAGLDLDYAAIREQVQKNLFDAFFGPGDKGVYSPSLQTTVYEMANAVLRQVKEVESIYIDTPNVHYLPVAPLGYKFEDDVFLPTSAPAGTICCTVSRNKHVSKDALGSVVGGAVLRSKL